MKTIDTTFRTRSTLEFTIHTLEDLLKKSQSPTFSDPLGKACWLISSLHYGGKLVLVGMGKSGYISQKLSATFSSTGTPSTFMHPSESLHGDLGMLTENDVVLALSNSGNTAEVVCCLERVKQVFPTVKILSITKSENSSVGRLSDVCIAYPLSREACPINLAPNTSTLVQLLLGDLLASSVMEQIGFSSESFRKFHPGGSLGKTLQTVGDCSLERATMATLSESPTVYHALRLLKNSRLVVYTKNNVLLGTFSQGDFVRLSLQDQDQTEVMRIKVEGLWHQPPVSVYSTELVSSARQKMADHQVSSLVVLDYKTQDVLGIFSSFNGAN
jgi:arabinose-5-phosphate isomerase